MTSDRAIVTLRDPSNRFETDLELPTDVPFSELTKKVAVHLSAEVPELFQSSDKLAFLVAGRVLSDGETLASVGLWSGSIIDIQRG